MSVTPAQESRSRNATYPRGIEIGAPVSTEFGEVLTSDALGFLASLARIFEPRRQMLLDRRRDVQDLIAAGNLPGFPPETSDIRKAEWTVAPAPSDLTDRRVEITGPVERKMMINALNSGASVFMADFEDASSPTLENVVQGQVNLRDTVRRSIRFTNEEGREYRLKEKTAVLMVRPRGWHLDEKHVTIDGRSISASLFDFGLYLFHNAHRLLESGTGPYFYLPKLEHYLEARLWNDVFDVAERALGLPRRTIKATVLIETILAAFQMDEILWELRDHSAGLNCGRWDYIFSIIKKFRHDRRFLMPDRSQVTMSAHMMRSYSLLCIRTCHRRDTHAIGGMSAFIPVKGNQSANDEAFRQVTQDKEREVGDGHDGTWVAHPGLVAVAKAVFDRAMPEPNQIDRKRDDVSVSQSDLLRVPDGTRTEQGLRLNIEVGIRYLESWLRGQGAAAINNLMEDAATCEISRAQIWQWVHHGATLDDGRPVSEELVRTLTAETLEAIRSKLGEHEYAESCFPLATHLFTMVAIGPDWDDFLTHVAYDQLP